MPKQTEAGKAFEYALIMEFFDKLKEITRTILKKDNSFLIARNCFNKFNYEEQGKYRKASSLAVSHLIELEPHLTNSLSPVDELELSVVPDKVGIRGDVRDILVIRKKHNWVIGISAKNQHRAVKHSRLSDRIDFGKKWLDISCSDKYFETIAPLFFELRELRKKNVLWRELPDKDKYYVPLLNAFKDELVRLDKANPRTVPQRLLHYLIGNRDFYKVIKEREGFTIQAFNLNGTLNKPFGRIEAKHKISKLSFPSRIVDLYFKNGSKNTLMLICDKGWQISFRIHNASTKVEPSLKFDINLEGNPPNLYTHHIFD